VCSSDLLQLVRRLVSYETVVYHASFARKLFSALTAGECQRASMRLLCHLPVKALIMPVQAFLPRERCCAMGTFQPLAVISFVVV
jgi:hypothetical protein